MRIDMEKKPLRKKRGFYLCADCINRKVKVNEIPCNKCLELRNSSYIKIRAGHIEPPQDRFSVYRKFYKQSKQTERNLKMKEKKPIESKSTEILLWKVDPVLKAKFKARCAEKGETMRGVIFEYMRIYVADLKV
jgi:hypothetical protein